jgi:hypothetical protein
MADPRENASLETLDRRMAELAGFVSPSEIFRALLEGTAAGSPRAAIYLLREGRFKGWSSIGYPPQAAASHRAITLPVGSGWLGSVAEEADVRWRTLTSGEQAPQFGQGRHAEVVALPVRVAGKAVALIVAEREPGEQPWSPAALSLLCQAARLRLELDLAWRRLKNLQGEPVAAVPVAVAAPAPAPAPAPIPVAAPAPAPSAATEIAPWSEATEKETDPRREEARRFARLVATDIRLYNEEAVVLGRREGDLSSRLSEPMARGREAYAKRFPDLGQAGAKLLDEAFVQVLAGGDASLLR